MTTITKHREGEPVNDNSGEPMLLGGVLDADGYLYGVVEIGLTPRPGDQVVITLEKRNE